MQVYVTVHMTQAAEPLDFSLSPFPPRFTNGGYNVVTFAGGKAGEFTEDADDEDQNRCIEYTWDVLKWTICCPLYCLCMGDQALPWMRYGNQATQ